MEFIRLQIWKWEWILSSWKYSNGRIWLLLETDEWEDIGDLTKNLVDLPCGDNEIYLDWNHNFWRDINLVNVFYDNWLIKYVIWTYKSGFCHYPRCVATDKLLDYIDDFNKYINENI